MSTFTLTCRTCGDVYDLPQGENHKPCPACGAQNCRPQAEADVGDTLRRATTQRLRCDFVHAESSYQYVLRESPDEHEAMWGLVQCRYAVEYVKDPRTGKPMPIVHGVQKKPMLTDPDFREACALAPEAVREQYRAEAAYIDDAMAKIIALSEKGDGYDVFLCHKTSRTDGEEGYTEDYNRAVQLYIMLREMGYKVFFAPFAGLTPGEEYEAGIYHAISTTKVMLVICSNQDHINSPWVRTEWQRYLEMSYEPGADKHLIPLLYGDFPPRRLPDDFRRLQAITMGELNAKDTLVAAIRTFVGEKAAAAQTVPAPGTVQHAQKPEQPKAEPAPKPKPVQPAQKPEQPKAEPAPKPKPVQPAQKPAQPKPVQPAPKPTPAYAPESHFTTEAADGGVAIMEYTGPGGEVLIPPTIRGKKVVEISARAFYGCSSLMSVSIPESVTSIKEWAFYGCSRLTSVSIPAAVTQLLGSAFANCQALTSIAIAAENKNYYVRDGMLMSRDNSLLCYPAGLRARSYTIPAGVTSIRQGAFCGCSSLTSVSIPDSVTYIGGEAFAGCSSLTSVSIPNSVTLLGYNPFPDCKTLSAVAVAAGNEKYYVRDGVLMSRDNSLVCYPAGLTAKSYTIPEIVTSIRQDAFCGCSSLMSVSIPESVTSIGDWAFVGCSSLTSVSIPDSVTSIELGTFKDCSSLTSVSIPDSVTSIGDGAFKGCSSLTSVSIPESVTSIGDWAFAGCSSLTSVSIPDSVTSIGDWAFNGCRSLTSVSIPDSVTSIGENAFSCCDSLTSVSIPDSVTSIGDSAFLYCSSLTSVSIPDSVTSIEHSAFFGCSSLTSVSIPAKASIGANAFYGCDKLPLLQKLMLKMKGAM